MRTPAPVRAALVALLWAGWLHPAAAQVSPAAENSAETRKEQTPDPLRRTTPLGTLAGFIHAVERDDFVAAARYMQVTEHQRGNTEALARDLVALMDRYLSQALTSISDSPDGALDDGLQMDQERVGPLTIGDRKIDIALVRVTDPRSGPIWLISSETLDQVPALRASIHESWIERVMPTWLVRHELFGISVAHWIVLAASLLIPFGILALLSAILVALARVLVRDAGRRRDLESWHAGLRWPLITTLTLAIQLASMPSLGFPLAFRGLYARVAFIALVLAVTWLIRRILTLGFARARRLSWGPDQTSTRSLLLLGERLLKAFIVLVAVFAILSIAGVDTKTALAGVGIGGIALALGAQRTVENLLGGIFLLSDRAIAVGDLCSISGRLGWIEDITLRSVRLRTLDQSLVSIPAGVLAQAGIENFATRHKVLAQSVLRLRYGTTVEQLRRILDSIRRLLDEHPRIERGTSRIRLVNFGDEAIELELFAYLLTADIPEFLAIREELLLKIAEIAEAAGSGFAPTRFIYVEDEWPGAESAVRPRPGASISAVSK